MKPNKFYHLLFPCLLGGMLLFPTGCSNDDYDAVIDESEEKCIPIDITLSGIQTLFGPYGEEARNVQYNKIHETRDLDKNHILETLVMAEPDTLRPPLTRATSALTNTTLRLVAYDNSGEYKGIGVYNISSTGEVTPSEILFLTKSGSYTFHCFSPAQTVTVSGNTVTVELPAAGTTTDPAFYYAKTSAQSIKIDPSGNKKIAITVPVLLPQSCKLTLDVKHHRGKVMSYSDAVVTGLHTGASLTLPAGTVTNNTPTTSTTISSSSPTIYVYPGSTGSSFGITVHSVTIDGVSKGSITHAAISGTMRFVVGRAYKLSVSILAPNYIKIADLPFKVARGNLLYNSTTGKWYLAPDQGYYYKDVGGYETLNSYNSYGSPGDKVFSYFNWGVRAKFPNFSLTSSGPYADAYGGSLEGNNYGTAFGYNSTEATSADTDVSNYKDNNDPCYAALGGSWHLPTGGSTSSDIGYFAKASNTSSTQSYQKYTTKSSLSSSSTRTVFGHYFGTTTQPSSANQDKYVFLPAAGSGYDATGRIEYEGMGGYGNYWSSTGRSGSSSYYHFFSSRKVEDGREFDSRYYQRSVRCISY